jgi:hypothetical protein
MRLSQCYTQHWLDLVDAKLAEIQQWDNGFLAKRPAPLNSGLEILATEELRRFCAASSCLDMRGGVGKIIDSRDSLP